MTPPQSVGKRLVLLCVAAAALTGCAQGSLYEWGDYQDALYEMWIDPEDFDPGDHLRILTDQIAACDAEQLQVPPGLRAHVAMLHMGRGNSEEARRFLLAEKAAFPEATVFVDGLLARMSR